MRELLLSLAGRVGHAFEVSTMIAGFACHARGVEIEAADAKSARAVVKSKRVHTVDLRAKDGTLAARCSCPADEMGTFPCKHVWAALLEIDKLGGLADLRAKRGPLTVIRKPASRPKARKPKRPAQPSSDPVNDGSRTTEKK